jgi:hypothetical protein
MCGCNTKLEPRDQQARVWIGRPNPEQGSGLKWRGGKVAAGQRGVRQKVAAYSRAKGGWLVVARPCFCFMLDAGGEGGRSHASTKEMFMTGAKVRISREDGESHGFFC